jgi:hypothetical protein
MLRLSHAGGRMERKSRGRGRREAEADGGRQGGGVEEERQRQVQEAGGGVSMWAPLFSSLLWGSVWDKIPVCSN